MASALERLQELNECIDRLRKAFGPPGDYGYGTPMGDALLSLYRARIAPTDENEGFGAPEKINSTKP